MAKPWVDVVAGFLVSLILCGVALGGVVPIVTTVEDLGDKITVIESDRDDSGFASVCRPIGDVNGDGRQDFAFFGQYVAGDAPMVGYVFLGRQSLPPRLELSRWYEWGIKFTGYETDRWPIPRAELGDLDGDGFGDMVFGVPV